MTVKCVSSEVKNTIVRAIREQGASQTDVADAFGISRRTVGRIIKEAEEITDFTQHSTDIELVCVVKSLGITSAKVLEDALKRPALTLNNVVLYIADLSDDNFDKMNTLVKRVRELRKERENAAA
ncbi:helix-turn-helix domain-containing protein [Marinobacter shengliensis]|uniref:helix-turn-helix domain-containing protein n=1 Tax=Marinobacter shengliensis TaxID=1389223 RepID=UPI001E4A3B59|nr:helix-turn-helix domain-containing protein [Marinobacter shengliensis]MCD1628489.1 helix-turn-helix domain-containing protein [Marinobacter shengliensis]